MGLGLFTHTPDGEKETRKMTNSKCTPVSLTTGRETEINDRFC